MKKHIALIAAALLLFGCGASSRPELKTKINSFFSTAGTRDFGASRKFSGPMPYAVGQFVVHGVTEGKDKRSITRTSIAGREGDGWIFEFYTLTETQEGAMQMLVTGFGKAAKEIRPEDLDIKWVKTRDENGVIQTFEGPMLDMMKSMYKKSLSSLKIEDTAFTNGGSVRVPAGVFSSTLKYQSKSSMLGRTFTSTGYFHSSVPINGIVKSVSDDDSTTMELLSFGTSGAVSLFK